MDSVLSDGTVPLDLDVAPWERVFMVAPLVVIGTVEGDGYDLAPKHMAMPFGWQNYFGFVCTPRHATYHNAKESGAFTVSFPRAQDIVQASLAASPRDAESDVKSILSGLPVVSSAVVQGVFLRDSYLFLECELDRIIDGFGDYSLIVGCIVAAHAREDAVRISELDDADLIEQSPLLAYLCPGRYATVSETFSFPLPEGIRW